MVLLRIQSDNGPVLITEAIRQWIEAVGVEPVYIEPGSPWENGYCESFNARFRDKLLNGGVIYTLRDAQIVTGQWRRLYNTKRSHSAIGYRPPAPESVIHMEQKRLMHEIFNRTERWWLITSLIHRLKRPKCFDDGQVRKPISMCY